ncbi:MAG: hypothetical protein U0167_00800 [bacterium]
MFPSNVVAVAASLRLAVRLLCLALLGALLPPAMAAAGFRYESALGTFPQDQGWEISESINPPQSYPCSVGPEGLFLDTTGFGINVPRDVGGAVWWSHEVTDIDFTQDFVIEASVRIVSAPDGSLNTDVGWPRPGYMIAVSDVNERFFWLGFGSGTVFLSNDAYGHYGEPNTVVANFNTTDAHHVYRMQRAAGGVGAALFIDGVPALELPAIGPVTAAPLIYFGDGTFWANSSSHTSWVRVDGPASVGANLWPAASPLRASPLGNPSGAPRVAFSSGRAGTLSFEMFDVAGRRVEGIHRLVSAGDSGTFDAPGTLRAGVYFYRLALSPSSGLAGEPVVSAGRLVLVR